jgi:chromosome partitioning protein
MSSQEKTMHKPEIIAICNLKGGVGKTTCALNIAAGLTRLSKKVLVVDFDPQAHLTYSFSFDANNLKKTIYSVIKGAASLEETLIEHNGFKLLPANLDLTIAETELIATPGREYVLKNILDNISDVQYIIIDCSPASGFLTINALACCHEIYIPLQMEFLALKGMSRLLSLIREVKNNLNKELPVPRIIATRFDSRKKLNNVIMKKVRERFGRQVFNAVIRENIAVAEAPIFAQSIFEYAPKSHGAEDFMNLCKEIIK